MTSDFFFRFLYKMTVFPLLTYFLTSVKRNINVEKTISNFPPNKTGKKNGERKKKRQNTVRYNALTWLRSTHITVLYKGPPGQAEGSDLWKQLNTAYLPNPGLSMVLATGK